MALRYLIQNFAYPDGFDRQGRLMDEDYRPGSLQALYGGRAGRLYTCAPAYPARAACAAAK